MRVGPPMFPAAATTTIPLNQSCSNAWSSGSFTNEDGLPESSESLTTRIPYALWFSSTHCAAAMTSLTSDSSFASAVRIETIGEAGAAPGYDDEAPAASPATIVP